MTTTDHDPKLRPGHAALRRGRVSLAGQVYLLTTTTRARATLFADFRIANAVAASLCESRLWSDSRLLAWVLMPDHWHALIELGRQETLDSLVRRVKAVTSRTARTIAPDLQRVWASGYHDRALRNGEHIVAAARYLVGNPLRAGLVQRIGDYPYWDAIWLCGEEIEHESA